jgi:hypothetical protein
MKSQELRAISMGRYRATTGLREIINEKRFASLVVAFVMLATAVAYIAYLHRPPELRPTGNKAFYTIDDGNTWFTDSIFKTPPFDHNGKIAVRAMVYSYDNGRKQFCPFVQRYTTQVKKTLDDAIALAIRDGKPLSSIELFKSPMAIDAVEVKASCSDGDWVPGSDKERAGKIISAIKAPDGSAVDFVIP